MAQRSLTGVKPSGTPHIGNLKGAIEPALALAETYETFYFVASYHALTTTRDADVMRKSVIEVAATWLACGLDPERTVLWSQHDVPEVCELQWVLSCVTQKHLMDKGHAFKDMVAKGLEANVGLYTYPILQAADILAFDSNVVPVGKDQRQHVEMTRDIAQRFNNIFGEALVVPEALIRDDVAVVPGTDGQKMSKSYGNTLPLFITSKKLRKAVMRIVTDSTPVEDPKDPATCNVFGLYKLFATPDQQAELANRYRTGGMGYGHAKQALFEVMDAHLSEPRARYNALLERPDEVRQILAAGAERARPIARQTLDRVRDRVGL